VRTNVSVQVGSERTQRARRVVNNSTEEDGSGILNIEGQGKEVDPCPWKNRR